MIKRFLKYLNDRWAYYYKKWQLERTMKKYHGKWDSESKEKHYVAFVEWCAHTKSDKIIYCSSEHQT